LRFTAETIPAGMARTERHQQRGAGQLEGRGHALDDRLNAGSPWRTDCPKFPRSAPERKRPY
jgi:hypothetical protein